MLATALRQLKYHPGRYLATLVAIAISVGFMAAASIITATESHAIGAQQSQPFKRANLVVEVSEAPDSLEVGQVTQAVSGIDGVAAAEFVRQLTLVLEHGTAAQFVPAYPQPTEPFQWATLKQGAWPQGAQIALNSALAKALGVTVGDQVDDSGDTLTVSGITDSPPSLFQGNPAILDPTWVEAQFGTALPVGEWGVILAPGADQAAVSKQINSALTSMNVVSKVTSAAAFLQEQSRAMTGEIDTGKYILWIFAGIAMVVGLITIANTFTILLTQRRRQIGLLRSIGASGAQVRHSILAEAIILGLVGGLLGIGLACGLAALLGIYTGSAHFGLVVPWLDTSVALVLGLVITLIASIAPARRATRIPPLEALQPAQASVGRLNFSVVRAVLCSVLVVAGLAGSILSLQAGNRSLLLAVGSAMLICLGVLFGARFFVPALLKLAGAMVRRLGPPAALAAENVSRDPARTSATATALMLAVGLIITLQVGAASINATIQAKISAEYPIDVSVSAWPDQNNQISLPQAIVDQLRAIPGVADSATAACRDAAGLSEENSFWLADRICAYTPEVAGLSSALRPSVADDQILIQDSNTRSFAGLQVTPDGLDHPLTVVGTALGSVSYAFVSPTTYAQLAQASQDRSVVFLTLAKDANLASVVRSVQDLVTTPNAIAAIDGSAMQRAMVEQSMTIMVGVITALLAVAILIALVGVGNTLTLSVIERGREHALLRAMGFKRGQLRLMLLVEALLLTIVGAVAGLIAGLYFGWLGASAVVAQFGAAGVNLTTRFALNWPQTIGLLAILVVAAVLASVLPGRRAAQASPVEALADI